MFFELPQWSRMGEEKGRALEIIKTRFKLFLIQIYLSKQHFALMNTLINFNSPFIAVSCCKVSVLDNINCNILKLCVNYELEQAKVKSNFT